MILEGPRSIDIACQDAVQVEIFSDKLLELVDDGHFNTGKRRCGMGGWFWGFICNVKGGFYRHFRCLGAFLIFQVLGVQVSCC